MSAPEGRTVCPPQLERARAVAIGSALLGVIGLVAALSLGDDGGLTLVFGLVGIVLQIVLGMQLTTAGRNWARIVLTIFIVLALISFVIGIAGLGAVFAYGGVGVLLGLLSIVQTALGVWLLVLMWNDASTRFLTRS